MMAESLKKRAAAAVAGSGVFRGASACFGALAGVFESSAFAGFLARPERTTPVCEGSLFWRVVSMFFSLWDKSAGAAGRLAGHLMQGSMSLVLLKWFGERYYLFFCAFIALQSLVVSASWHNYYALAALAVLAASFWARTAFCGARSPDAARLDPVFAVYALMIALSGAASAKIPSSISTSILYLVSFLFFILVIATFGDREHLKQLIAALTASACLMSLYGIWQYLGHIPMDETITDTNLGGASLSMGRVYSTIDNPNVLAGWLLMILPYAVAMAMGARSLRRKLFFAAASLPILACLFLTQSRSAWIGLFASVVVFVFLLNWRLVPLFAALGLLSFPFWPRFILDRLFTLGRDSSSTYRLEVWGGALRMALDNFLTGAGIGVESFTRFFGNYTSAQIPKHSHNLFLQIWIESGAPAMLAFAWFCARLLKKCLFALRPGGGPLPAGTPASGNRKALSAERLLIIAGASSLCGFLSMGMFEFIWFFPRCMNMFFIITGMAVCACNASYQASRASAAGRPAGSLLEKAKEAPAHV